MEAAAEANEPGSTEGKSQLEAAEEGEPATEEQWVQYKFDQSKEDLALRVPTQNGVLKIENIAYQLNPDTFPAGNFEIVVTDVTEGIPDEEKLEQMRLDLKLFDSEADAEQAAAQAAAGGGKKKK